MYEFSIAFGYPAKDATIQDAKFFLAHIGYCQVCAKIIEEDELSSVINFQI